MGAARARGALAAAPPAAAAARQQKRRAQKQSKEHVLVHTRKSKENQLHAEMLEHHTNNVQNPTQAQAANLNF